MNTKTTLGRVLALTLVPLMLCLASCGMTLKESGAEGAVDKSSGTVWKHASTCYEAIELGEKVGKLQVSSKYSLDLHKITDMDETKWLATQDGDVLYAEGTTLPTLTEMNPTSARICVEDETTKALGVIQDAEKLSAIMSAYTQDKSLDYPAKIPLRTYRVRFISPDYPGLYYSLTYIEYSADYVSNDVNYGKYFLYDAFDKIFVPVGDEIHTTLGLS